MIKQLEAIELFSYNPETGILTRNYSLGNSIAGSTVGTLKTPFSTNEYFTQIDGYKYKNSHLICLILKGFLPVETHFTDHNKQNTKLDNLIFVDLTDFLNCQIKAEEEMINLF